MTGAEWIVVLEVQAKPGGDVGPPDLERLLGCLAEHYPSALHAEDRYALQLVVQGPAPDDALADALHLWRGALRCCGLPAWAVVRAEVKTPAELAAEYDDDHPFGVKVYGEATRDVLEAMTASLGAEGPGRGGGPPPAGRGPRLTPGISPLAGTCARRPPRRRRGGTGGGPQG
jgi:hypothetical protein